MTWASFLFPTHLFFYKIPQHPHNALFLFPPHFSFSVRAPCFPLDCLAGCVNVLQQLCNVISWELSPPALWRCITCRLPQWGSLFSAFLRHKKHPLMETALSKVLTAALHSNSHTGETLQQSDLLHNGTQEQRFLFIQMYFFAFWRSQVLWSSQVYVFTAYATHFPQIGFYKKHKNKILDQKNEIKQKIFVQ